MPGAARGVKAHRGCVEGRGSAAGSCRPIGIGRKTIGGPKEGRDGRRVLENALPLLGRAAHGKVEGIVGGLDPFESVKNALAEGAYDDVLISTLPQRLSEWLRRDLPHRWRSWACPSPAREP